MSTTFSPRPGTVAYRAIAVLEMRPTAEHTASHIALELGGSVTASDVAASLAAAVQAGAVHRRQRDRTTPRAPWYYSLTDLDKHARLEGHVNTWPWMQRTADADVPVFIARGAEPSTDTPQGDQAGSEPAREVMEPEACESAAGRGTNGAPALATLPQHASPGVGPMGAGQPADAGPTTDDQRSGGHGTRPCADEQSEGHGRHAPVAAPGWRESSPLHHDEQPREVDAQFAASLRAAMHVDVDDDCLARGAELGRRKGEQLHPADQAATRRAVHAPHEPAPLAFRAARFTDGSLATERDGIVVAVYSAAEVDAIQKLLGVRG